MSDGFFGEFDASLTIGFDDIAAHIWVALGALDDEAVVATRGDDVFPHFCRTELRSVRAGDLDAIFVGALNLILDDVRLVVVDLDTDLV
eukprot:CAMPEP_0170458084 /NCGR_PEP_ID=MMETSP0123-20130129/5161_1 /TAXON_ID=182087 /ORGANISM="Favella ehrenbergii, Strain Fehren 1" /LENGTH=88 /DNA_ID=CAMNT_0010722093 /DNA_START=856 /DNA_END=1122 /DNA_ORIENTATION=+